MSLQFLTEECTFYSYDHEDIKKCNAFKCPNKDLTEFFQKDASNYSRELLGKTYCFTLNSDPCQIVAAFTLANDGIKVSIMPNNPRNKVAKKIPREKSLKSYPAVLIGRLGVHSDFAGKHIGDGVLDFIKVWFINPANKTGCRYIVVDSYNTDVPLKYYLRNDFQFLFKDESQEAKYQGIKFNDGDKLKTRLLYFDLIDLRAVI